MKINNSLIAIKDEFYYITKKSAEKNQKNKPEIEQKTNNDIKKVKNGENTVIESIEEKRKK